MKYQNLIGHINADINTNGQKLITGAILNDVLQDIVSTLGSGYRFGGVIAPSSVPPDPVDDGVFYIASTYGTYTNFGGITVSSRELAVIVWDSTDERWAKHTAEQNTVGYIEVDSETGTIPSNDAPQLQRDCVLVNDTRMGSRFYFKASTEGNSAQFQSFPDIAPNRNGTIELTSYSLIVEENDGVYGYEIHTIETNTYLNTYIDTLLAGKQDTLRFDTEPMYDSDHAVTSGGVYDALALKADDSDVVHKTGDEIISGTKNIDGDIWLQNYRVKVGTDEVQMLTGSKFKLYGDSYIDANGRVVTGIPTPSNDTEAANKKYVDDSLATKANNNDVVHLKGNETIAGVKTFSGTLVTTGSASFTTGATVRAGLDIGDTGIYMNGTKVEGLGKPTNDSDAATKEYVDDGLAAKEGTISDLATIRSGAAAGATAVQPATMQTALDGKADKVAKATTQPAGGFAPNTCYELGEITEDTTFALAAATDNTIANIWWWSFETGATLYNVNMPAGVTEWAGGSAPTLAANKRYEITVKDGLGAYIES